MSYKKILLLFLVVLKINSSFGQIESDYNSKELDILNIYSTPVIKLNFRNLYFALRMTNQRFQDLMTKYNYSYTENMYVANTSAGKPTYTIDKKPGEVKMIWTLNKSFATHLKDQIERAYIRTDSDWATYFIKDKDDANFHIKILLNDQGDNGMVVMKRERN